MATSWRRSVLVADPDPAAGAFYADVLDCRKAQILHAIDGRDALVQALCNPLTLAIIETVLPYVDGYSLCEILRRDRLTQSIPIIVVTADVRSGSLTRAVDAGADAAMAKPIEADLLRDQTTRLLGSSRDLRDSSQLVLVHAQVRGGHATFTVERSITPRRIRKSLAHGRYQTSAPPAAPPPLRCSSCADELTYVSSYVGGVTRTFAEQWDRYSCPNGCGVFQYRHRTRKLRAV
jgi:DNA-binding response OmpR family regulator